MLKTIECLYTKFVTEEDGFVWANGENVVTSVTLFEDDIEYFKEQIAQKGLELNAEFQGFTNITLDNQGFADWYHKLHDISDSIAVGIPYGYRVENIASIVGRQPAEYGDCACGATVVGPFKRATCEKCGLRVALT